LSISTRPDNPFGNYEAMKTELLKSSKDRVLMRAYGVPTKKAANMFAKFNTSVHVIPPDRVPKTGVNYHVVDPCSGRNVVHDLGKVRQRRPLLRL
jgi:hypothetical protein